MRRIKALRFVYTVDRQPDGEATFFDSRQCAIGEAVRLNFNGVYRWRVMGFGAGLVMDRAYSLDGRCVWRAIEENKK